jgi:hypothetical protein
MIKSDAKVSAKNVRTFIFGCVLYIILFSYLTNINNDSHKYEWSLGYILFADILVMSAIYKLWKGSSILNEVNDNMFMINKNYLD